MAVKRKDLIIVEPMDKLAVVMHYANKFPYWVRIYSVRRRKDGSNTCRLTVLTHAAAKFKEEWEAYEYIRQRRIREPKLRHVKGLKLKTPVYTEAQVTLMALAGEIED